MGTKNTKKLQKLVKRLTNQGMGRREAMKKAYAVLQKRQAENQSSTPKMEDGGDLPEYVAGGIAGASTSMASGSGIASAGSGMSTGGSAMAGAKTFNPGMSQSIGTNMSAARQGNYQKFSGTSANKNGMQQIQPGQQKPGGQPGNKPGGGSPIPSVGVMGQKGKMAGSIADKIDAQNGRSDGGQAVAGGLKGAGTGASIGTMIAPGIGTAIGAGVGAVAGVFTADKPSNNHTWSKSELKRRRELKQQQKKAVNADAAPTSGEGANFYKKGGKSPAPSNIVRGGKTEELSSNTIKYKGRSHKNGGIDVNINKDPSADIEVEGGEVQRNNKIYSDSITIKDKKGKTKTVADKATEISKKIGDFEKLANDYPMDNEKQNTAGLMKRRLTNDLKALFQVQEQKKSKGEA